MTVPQYIAAFTNTNIHWPSIHLQSVPSTQKECCRHIALLSSNLHFICGDKNEEGWESLNVRELVSITIYQR
jgi:hypothetical protein